MAMSRTISTPLAIALLFMTFIDHSYGALKVGFYADQCGHFDVEQVIHDVVRPIFKKDPKTVAALLRMQFHDCIVGGCEAAILLDGQNTEKTAQPNLSVRGYDVIDACKTALEKQCPGVVSCADIIIIATRAAVNLAGGKFYQVETGRKDGLTSKASDAISQLPGATIAVKDAIKLFGAKGMSAEDFVYLLGGGHTVGFFHCNFFLDRLYNFKNSGNADLTMAQATLISLRKTCPRYGPNKVAACDQSNPGSPLVFDNGFYTAIAAGKGVIQIDQQIALDPSTKSIVSKLANSKALFDSKFGTAMLRLGRAKGTLTGTQGQIRTSCRAVNPTAVAPAQQLP